MTLNPYFQTMLPAIEGELHAAIARAFATDYPELRSMLAYHLGWEGEGAGPEAQGKRIRPLLLLLSCAAAGGTWQDALPAAAAVELIHNFSLIHDDIQDNSPLRRGRPTVWVKWGREQAINAGDLMFTIAHLTLYALEGKYPPATILEAGHSLQAACVRLTQGQYLDLAFETAPSVTLDAYWDMIGGKTAALLGLCARLGALLGTSDAAVHSACETFGYNLGLAFQVQDDLLGIWGDAQQIGKSTQSDLEAGKKTLPVIYGLSRGGDFARRWAAGAIAPDEVAGVAQGLAAEGAYDYAKEAAARLTQASLQALASLPPGDALTALEQLADRLLHRQA